MSFAQKKVASAGLSVLLLILICSGCRSSVEFARMSEEAKEPAFVFALHGEFAPALSTNEVMRIAFAAARTHKFKLDYYTCTALSFAGNTTNASLTNKWLIHFAEKPPVPDTDFFVVIDDSTRAAEVFHY